MGWFNRQNQPDDNADTGHDDDEVNTRPDNAIPIGMVNTEELGCIPILGEVDSETGEIHYGKTVEEAKEERKR